MSKASEEKLSKLHGVVAEAYIEIIETKEEVTTINEDGEFEKTGEMRRTVSPAYLTGAVKFLNDNNIKADLDQIDNMDRLADALAKKKRRSDTRLGDPSKAAHETH